MPPQTPPTEHTLQLRRTVAAPPEKAFDAWIQPERMKKWFCRGRDAAVVQIHEADARVGGRLALSIDYETQHHELRGEYRVVDRPKKLAFTWSYEGNPAFGVTLVTVDFRPLGNARMTEVLLRHEGFRTQDDLIRHEGGWTECFAMQEKTKAYE